MADDATTLNYVDDATTVDETADATTVTVSDDSTVVESAAAGAPGVGVPSGGTTGQALVKNSNADYDTHWATPSTVAALDDLTDVIAPTPANGDGLVFNGTAWVNVDVATQAELNAHTGGTGTSVHGLGTASTHNVPASGNAAVGEVVKGDDSRLSDARTPTAHASTHAPGGTDALPWTTIHGYGTAASRPAAASTNAGYIYLATDTGTLSRSNGASWDDLLKAGTGATNYTAGNDSRLSDTRTPTDGSVTSAKYGSLTVHTVP